MPFIIKRMLESIIQSENAVNSPEIEFPYILRALIIFLLYPDLEIEDKHDILQELVVCYSYLQSIYPEKTNLYMERFLC